LLFNLDDFEKKDWPFWIHLSILNFISFYLAYFILIPRMLVKKNLLSIVWISIFWVIGLTLARALYNYVFMELIFHWERHRFSIERQITMGFFNSVIYTSNAIFIYFSIEWFRERQFRFELIKEKQKSEIDLLKSQMNPHFLMNTLNNLYSLVYQGSPRASDAVLKLSDIMRYMLYDTTEQMVPLENEVKYLRSFIELEMLRFKNQELVDIDIEGEMSGKMIAPMVLIPFVENAFKHGNKYLPGMGIEIRLISLKEEIIFEVMNFKASKELQKDNGTGIGLQNIRKRLELQYPGSHVLEITDGIDYYKVYLSIRTQ
jgi:sensor histidine kinase YesM